MKILVDKLPEQKGDCPFEIPDNYFISSCILKVNHRELEEGLDYSMSQRANCDVCLGKPCLYLKDIGTCLKERANGKLR